MENIYILAIESSCDDTSVAILHNKRLLANVVSSQNIHQLYGGVVPELASRAHQQYIVPVVEQALSQANISLEQLSGIAFTKGPGLMGSLLVGVSFAKSMSLALGIPLMEVNHMHGHLLVHFIESSLPSPNFPFLGLTISGGHTQILQVNDYFQMTILGQTLDDAVGEAFDKTAKLLGLPYPGGIHIDQLAQMGNPLAYSFPIPKVEGLDFSFSGLKTSILYFIQKHSQQNKHFVEEHLADICASVQHTIVRYVMQKLHKTVAQTGIEQIVIGGGVSANSGLQKALLEAAKKHGWQVFIPAKSLSTDNAAMIGIAGYFKYKNGSFADLSTVADPRYNVQNH